MARGWGLACGWVAAALLLVPLAAGAAPASGDLRFQPTLHVDGHVTLHASNGVVDLADAIREHTPFRVGWAEADGWRVDSYTTYYGPGGVLDPGPGMVGMKEDTTNRSLRYGAGNLTLAHCTLECVALVIAPPGPSSAVGFTGHASGPAGWALTDRLYRANAHEGDSPKGFRYPVPAGTLQASGSTHAGHALHVANATPFARGDVLLFLKNVTATVETDDGTHVLDLRRTHENTTEAGDARAKTTTRSPFAVLRLTAVRVDAPSGFAGLFASPSATLEVEGTLTTPHAFGTLQLDGERHVLNGERVELVGNVRVDPAVACASPPCTRELMDAWQLTGGVAGGVDRAMIASWTVAFPDANPLADNAGALTAGAAAAAGVFVLHRLGFFALFSRTPRSRILEHPTRRHLYDAIREMDGATLPELVDRTGKNRGSVRYHLSRLVAYGLIRARDGRPKWYHVPPEGPSGSLKARARRALRAPKRRRIARALVAADAGLTQRALVARTGIPQRLVSYHLEKLKGSGLVDQTDGFPATYRAAPALADELAAAPPTPRVEARD